jgi:RTX calcium-binding nonapeptide repeat (4 copies)
MLSLYMPNTQISYPIAAWTLGITILVLVLATICSATLALSVVHRHSSDGTGVDGFLPIPNHLITPPNQSPPVPSGAIAGSSVPKNLIIGPSCTSSCPPLFGTNKDDIIYATGVTDASVFGLNGDDVILAGSGNAKIYGADGNDFLIAGSANAQIYGGKGDDVLVGGSGTSVLVGGDGNDQLYAGFSNDILIGGAGANYFDCGLSGNAVILDFNPAKGDTKAGNCKYVFTSGVSAVH